MPTEWINQCPKEPVPNAIFGMCLKSVCSGKACEVYSFKNYLYCDHGFTDNEDAHRGLHFQFTSYLPKDSRKVKERIVNYFPVTVTNPCYKIQDSAKTYCPKAVRHTADTPVFTFDGDLYCIHGYTSAWATNPEKYPLAAHPRLSDYWLHHNEEFLGSCEVQQSELKQNGSDSLQDCENKLAQMSLSPKQENLNENPQERSTKVSFDTPNTVRIQNETVLDARVNTVKVKGMTPSSSLSVLQNYHNYLKEGNDPLEFHEYETKFAAQLGDRCVHGYLPIDGHICKSVNILSACIG